MFLIHHHRNISGAPVVFVLMVVVIAALLDVALLTTTSVQHKQQHMFGAVHGFQATTTLPNTVYRNRWYLPIKTKQSITNIATFDQSQQLQQSPYTTIPSKMSRTALVLSTISLEHFSNSKNNYNINQRYQQILQLPGTIIQKLQCIDEVTKWRIAATTFVSTIVLNRSLIDRTLVKVWNHLTTSQTSILARIFRTDSYEWCLAIAAFTIIIHWYQYIDHQVNIANQKGIIHPYRKYRLQDRYIADKQRRRFEYQHQQQQQEEKDLVNQNNDSAKQFDPSSIIVEQSKWHVGAYFFELWVYALPLLTWDILSPRRHRRLAAFIAPTTIQIIKDVTGSLLFYDALFFIGHYMMHHIPILYRKIHAKHHITDEVRACDIVRLSLIEEVYDVGCSIVALNLLSAHPISRSIYNCIIVYLLTELHSGYDFPWTPQNVIPFNIASGSRRHHYHHRYGTHYYQKFFFTLDRIFGLFQKNDGTLKGDSIKRDAYIPEAWK